MATIFTYSVAIDTLKTLLERDYDSAMELIPATVNDKGETTADAVTVADMLDKLDAMKSRFATKSGQKHKPTAKQVENEGLMAEIMDALDGADHALTIPELTKTCAGLADAAPQRVSALLTNLRKAGKVKRVTASKGKTVATFTVGLDLDLFNEDGTPKN